jgi:uncharacterized membrane protein
MRNYRITNLKTNMQHFLNEAEKKQFLKINNKWHYFTEDMQTVNKESKHKKIEKILFNIAAVCICVASYLALCQLFAYIDTITL